LYNSLIEFGVLMELVRLINMYVNETYSAVRKGKHFSDMFPIKNSIKKKGGVVYRHGFSTLLYGMQLGGFR
jgi:hypothetical protein